MIWQIASTAIAICGVTVSVRSVLLGDNHGITHGMLMMIMALQVLE